MADFIPDSDANFQTWLTNFLNVAGASPADFGLNADEVMELQTGSATFTGAVQALDSAKTVFDSAVESKKTARGGAEETARTLVRRVQAHKGLTDAQRAALRITVRDATPTSGSASVPTRLVATGDASGTNRLTWERNGNPQGTQFVVEAKIGKADAWTLVDVVNATRYSHLGLAPGTPIRYRVRARRRGVASEPSNEASVYGG